ncbi:MAG TPA: TSUP family transporter [Candidatus Saccharimonadia bacterium]
MTFESLALYAALSLGMSVFSGITGGGAGFVLTPLMILLGLSPAQAVSTSKISGLTLAVGSLGGLRAERVRIRRMRHWLLLALAVAVGLAVPALIVSLESTVYRIAMGVLILLMIPIMIIRQVGVRETHPGPVQRAVGLPLLALAMLLQGMFSGGLATLVNIVLMSMFGLTALEANVLKRWIQIVLNATIVLMAASGLALVFGLGS